MDSQTCEPHRVIFNDICLSFKLKKSEVSRLKQMYNTVFLSYKNNDNNEDHIRVLVQIYEGPIESTEMTETVEKM